LYAAQTWYTASMRSRRLIVGLILLTLLATCLAAAAKLRALSRSATLSRDTQDKLARLIGAESEGEFLRMVDRLETLDVREKLGAMDELAQLMSSSDSGIRLAAARALAYLLNGSAEALGREVDLELAVRVVPKGTSGDSYVEIEIPSKKLRYSNDMSEESLKEIRPRVREWWSECRRRYIQRAQ
jgi:hypothetical protein